MELMDTSLDKFYKKVLEKKKTIPEDILGKMAVSVSASWVLMWFCASPESVRAHGVWWFLCSGRLGLCLINGYSFIVFFSRLYELWSICTVNCP